MMLKVCARFPCVQLVSFGRALQPLFITALDIVFWFLFFRPSFRLAEITIVIFLIIFIYLYIFLHVIY